MFATVIKAFSGLFLIEADVFVFLHRMGTVLGMDLLPLLPEVLEVIVSLQSGQVKLDLQLVLTLQVEMLKQFLILINQLVSRHKEATVPFLIRLFPPLLSSSAATLRRPVDATDQNACAEQSDVSHQFPPL